MYVRISFLARAAPVPVNPSQFFLFFPSLNL